ncbi:class I SAM-dependent methyltransferase [Pedobacter nototheniae]|uniref:class I SAM-dependent methyltransferase n=1 Tax=Pedobacter nototheniae TaxID=2488994 RepID=UPI001038742D|nr:class I SAM-dependent methyltransferase [Pedobacter nototheniae]
MRFLKRVIKKIIKILFPTKKFDDRGERVDIYYKDKIGFDKFDIYQKSHYRRYEFAAQIISANNYVGDFACGTGYGSILLSKQSKKVLGVDISHKVIAEIQKRYKNFNTVSFHQQNLLHLDYNSEFDTIVSFETIEHFKEEDIERLFGVFNKALKTNGKLIFSTPYLQEKSEVAISLGHHLTFYIDEQKLEAWLRGAGFLVEYYRYQNYQTHEIKDHQETKDFIICVASKIA